MGMCNVTELMGASVTFSDLVVPAEWQARGEVTKDGVTEVTTGPKRVGNDQLSGNVP